MRSTKNALLRVIPTPTCHSDILSGTLSDSAAPQHRELAEARGGEGGRGGGERGEEEGGVVPLFKSRDPLAGVGKKTCSIQFH